MMVLLVAAAVQEEEEEGGREFLFLQFSTRVEDKAMDDEAGGGIMGKGALKCEEREGGLGGRETFFCSGMEGKGGALGVGSPSVGSARLVPPDAWRRRRAHASLKHVEEMQVSAAEGEREKGGGVKAERLEKPPFPPALRVCDMT